MARLSLESYARLLAQLACRRGSRPSEILGDLGIDAEDLRAADVGMREHLARAWDERAGIAAMKFAAALGAELKRLGPIADDGVAAPRPVEPSSSLTPFETRGGDAIEQTLASSEASSRTGATGGGPAEIHGDPKTPSGAADTASIMRSTKDVTAKGPRDHAVASSTDQRVDEGRMAAPPPDIEETANVDITMFRRRPLPFAAGAPPAGFLATDAPIASAPSPAVGADVHRKARSDTPDETGDVDIRVFRRPALPFHQGAPPGAGSGPPDVARGPAPASVPELTLEQYAALRAQLAVHGEDDVDTLHRFEISSKAAKEAIQAHFAERFRRDPALQAWFVELVHSRTAELRMKPPR